MGPLQQFTYAIRSPTTREQYQIWLRRFFKDVLVNGELDEQCIKFVKQSRKDSKWPLRQITGFLQKQRDRIDKKEVTVSTVRNYAKAIRLFCEVNEIDKYIKWKNLTRGLPNGRKWADDRAPTLEEIRKMTEYPDRRIKPIIYTMCSGGGIRRGAWDYLKWGHITSIGTDGVAKMRVYAGEDEEYWTFISPEVYKSLQGWMDFRRQSGEEITKDSWVMRQL
jgi:integrase